MYLIESNEFVKIVLETADVLNNFFSNIVQNLDIPRDLNDETLVSNTNNTTLKSVFKYRNNPSIVEIQNKYKDKGSFNFIEVDQKNIQIDIIKLDVVEAS